MRKYISYVLVLFIFMFVGIINVKAIDATITNKGFSWSGVTDYSVSKLKCTNTTFSNANDITSANVLKAATGSVTFNNPKNVTITCSIYIAKELTGNDVDQELISKSITVGTTTTKKEETTTTTAANAAKSNNANIKTLLVRTSDNTDIELTPKFDSGTYEYQAEVSSTVKTVTLAITLDDSKATYVVSDNVNEELKAGDTTKIVITVTAEDGSKKAYNLNIKREALTGDATLKSITIKEVKDFKLKENKYKYTVNVAKSVKKLNISCVTNDENSTYLIEGADKIKDGSIVKITVEAQDGSKKVYTLTVKYEEEKPVVKNVKAEKNPLIIMGLSIVAFGLIGGIIYVIKK